MSTASKASDLADRFTEAALGQVPMMRAAEIGEALVAEDARLAIAFYATWLVKGEAPWSGIIWYNLGVQLERIGEMARAGDAYRKARRLLPHLDEPRHGLLRILMLDAKRRFMQDGKTEEAYLVCRELLKGGAFARRRSAAEIAALGETLAIYAFLYASHGWKARAEYLYEIYRGEGGETPFFLDQGAALAAERRASRSRPFPLGDRRLRCVGLELVDGGDPAAPMMLPAAVERCLANIDVDVISTLRLFVRGEPLLHQRLLSVFGAIEKARQEGPVRIDVVELWTDGHDLDMVQLEEALRCRCIDSIVVRCDGGGTVDSYRRPQPGALWHELMQFLDKVARYRQVYDLDVALRSWTRADGPEARERWTGLLASRGWVAEFAESDEPPPLIDGAPQSLAPDDYLAVGVDGSVGEGASLLGLRYSDILAARDVSTRISA